MQQTEIFCHFGPILPFQPPDNQEHQNFEIKKTPGDIIILHICTINGNHMVYDSWDIEHNRQNFLSFWLIFCPFTTLWTQKIKIFKKLKKKTKKKKPGDIIILHMCSAKNYDQMMYGSWDMVHDERTDGKRDI